MDKINNIIDLDEILFYSGEYSIDAASYTANRAFGSSVEGLGTLTKDETDNTIYFSKYDNVRYKERNTNLQNINDLYSDTLSYLLSLNNDFSLGYTYISSNRYNALYTYETDLNNDFNNADSFVSRDLMDFLIGLNTQTFNKQSFYKGSFEVSSIKIDQTYFTWYPQDTVAYVDKEEILKPIEFTYYTISAEVNDNIFDGPYNEDEPVYFLEDTTYVEYENILEMKNYAEENNFYICKWVTSYTVPDYIDKNYIIGGNYYSYIRQSYETINNTIYDKIHDKLNVFRNKYGEDQSIYAYYMWDCNSDIQLLISTNNLGVKNSTFKVSFTSLFDRWFDDTIDIKLSDSIDPNTTLAKITSGIDGKIYSVFANKKDRITGENILIDKDNTVEFITDSELTVEDEINILTPYAIDTLDLGSIKDKLATNINLVKNPWMEQGLNMRCLIFDDGDNTKKSSLQKIYGLNTISTLEYLDLSNIDKFSATPAFDKLENLKVFKATGSNVDSFRPKAGIHMYDVELPETIKSIKLLDNKFEEGDLMVAGVNTHFNGTFNYEPNSVLSSLTLRNIDNELTYSLIHNWYSVLDAENKLDSFKYLELQGVNWENIQAQQLINLKKFDINPNLSGSVSILGSGNYKWLTRNEYQMITKLYGVNAFIPSAMVNNKVFRNFDIYPKKRNEDFEFKLKIKNKTVGEYNETILDNDRNHARFEEILDIEFKAYQYDSQHNEVEADNKYLNRAANSFLDIIYNDHQTEFTFKKDEIDNFAYAKLNRVIDTSNSEEIKNISKGDILLFNGDTIIIYFEDVENTQYEFIKLGNITDVTVRNVAGITFSSIENWFNLPNYDEYEVEFIPSERETVIQELTVTLLSEDGNIIFDLTEDKELNTEGIKIAIDIDVTSEDLEKVQNKQINIEYDNSILNVEIDNTDENHYIVYILKAKEGYTFSKIEKTNFNIFCDANRIDTIQSQQIVLRKRIEYSYVDENNILVLSDMLYSIDGTTLIINDALVDVVFDEETNTLTID